ncbi:MAG: putative HD phosphohydrolase [Halioglobus sp.]|jgi:predicted HD phosphohydrolase
MNTIARANFAEMTDGTQEDWGIIAENAVQFWSGLAGRVLDHLRLLDGDFGGFPIDRMQHSLQTATLAHQDGRDEEYVVCALLHDIGDTLGSLNHADLAATILQPFVSEQNHWMVKHHGIFQGYYFFHYLGKDRNMRDQFKDHEFFNHTAEFCHKYDQKAFDKDFKNMTLDEFVPMVESVFSQPKNSMYL